MSFSSSQYEYFNAVLINEVDADGNNVELGGEFVLQPNDHFNNLSVNLSLSVVQVPTNMYNKGMFTLSVGKVLHAQNLEYLSIVHLHYVCEYEAL